MGTNILNLFSLMCRLVYGHHSELQAAPAQCLLSKFSGRLSIEDFRSGCVQFVKAPLFPFVSCVHEYGEKPLPTDPVTIAQTGSICTETAVFLSRLAGPVTTLDTFLELDKEGPDDLDDFELEEDEDESADLHCADEG